MLVNLYSIPVYKIKLPEHEQVQQDFADILDKDEYFSKIPSWYSPVDTTYGNPDASNLPFKTFIRSAITGLNEYLENFSIDLTLDYRIECWLNKYKPGSYQEVHNHVGVSQISCAYMMNTPKDHSSRQKSQVYSFKKIKISSFKPTKNKENKVCDLELSSDQARIQYLCH